MNASSWQCRLRALGLHQELWQAAMTAPVRPRKKRAPGEAQRLKKEQWNAEKEAKLKLAVQQHQVALAPGEPPCWAAIAQGLWDPETGFTFSGKQVSSTRRRQAGRGGVVTAAGS